MLFRLRKEAGVETVRKNKKSHTDKVQAVLDLKASDITGSWGVGQTKQRLANDGVHIPR